MTSELMKYGNSVELTKETIKTYLCPKATDQECMMFFEKCKLHKLNPFAGDANLVKYGDKAAAQMIVTEQAWNRKLQEMPGVVGIRDGLILKNKDGSIKEVEGEFYMDEELVGAWCEVKIKDKEPVIGKIRLADYDKKQAIWNSNKARMINKTCRVHAIRKAIPDMAGLYIEAEMDAVNGSQAKQQVSIDPTDAIDLVEVQTKKLEEFKTKISNAKDQVELGDIAQSIGEEITNQDNKAILRELFKVKAQALKENEAST
jgi:phage recombination protein Bet